MDGLVAVEHLSVHDAGGRRRRQGLVQRQGIQRRPGLANLLEHTFETRRARAGRVRHGAAAAVMERDSTLDDNERASEEGGNGSAGTWRASAAVKGDLRQPHTREHV